MVLTLNGALLSFSLLSGLNILVSFFCVCADDFQDLSKALHYPTQLITFYLLLWIYFLILKMLTETRLNPLSVIGQCSALPISHWMHGKCARINLSQAASGVILQNHRGLSVSIFNVKIAAVGSLKRVTERIVKTSGRGGGGERGGGPVWPRDRGYRWYATTLLILPVTPKPGLTYVNPPDRFTRGLTGHTQKIPFCKIILIYYPTYLWHTHRIKPCTN